jgi:hypothetical protein
MLRRKVNLRRNPADLPRLMVVAALCFTKRGIQGIKQTSFFPLTFKIVKQELPVDTLNYHEVPCNYTRYSCSRGFCSPVSSILCHHITLLENITNVP